MTLLLREPSTFIGKYEQLYANGNHIFRYRQLWNKY